MDNNSECNVLQQLLKYNSYIILLSGLNESPIHTVAKELCISLDGNVLDFMHLSKTDLQPLNDRVNALISEKKQVLIIKGLSFDKSLLTINADTHINISIKIEDVEISKQYKETLSTNYINKYFNYKLGSVVDELINNIFNFIIDSIEKKVYKKDYDKLNHKNFNNAKPISSMLISDPNTISIKDQKQALLEKENMAMDDEISFDKEDSDNDDDDDLLYPSLRIA